jgi:hypothetical protein
MTGVIAVETGVFKLMTQQSSHHDSAMFAYAQPYMSQIGDRSLKEECIESKPQLETHGPLAQNQPLLDA